MNAGYCLCRLCESGTHILKPNENCVHYWYCTTCNYHHKEDLVCKISNPHRWYCPNEACRTAYDVGKACEHSWYCDGCKTKHALDETCPNGYMYCSNQGCKKVLSPTESCVHYWACPECEKTHHAAVESDPCPQHYWFCIDCFRADPTKGIYAQTDGCPHHWWCGDCNGGSGQRYAENKSCEHRWGCSNDATGHAYNEACSVGNWYCTDCEGGTRYNHNTQSLCAHTWYCPDCHYGHKIADGCATRWYCPECTDENKVHTVENEMYCDHSWYCITCQKGHLFTVPCPNGYWFCKTCHAVYNSAGDEAILSDGHSWYCYIDEEYLGCKVGHLKTDACPNKYRWCGEDGCNRVYPPNTPCVHCWECPTCQITYGPNAMCPTDNTWCCGCPAVDSSETKPFCTGCKRWVCSDCPAIVAVKNGTDVCAHKWFCADHNRLNTANEKCAEEGCEFFGCATCGVWKGITKGWFCCRHYWFCELCTPYTLHPANVDVCPDCRNGWFCQICTRVYRNWDYEQESDPVHYWFCRKDHVRNPVNQPCPECNGWFCSICKVICSNETDSKGHTRPESLQNAPLLHAKKTSSEQSPFINNIPLLDVFKGSSDPSKEVHSSNDVPEEKNLINTVERSVHSEGDEPKQRLLHVAEKLKRKKEKLFREDLKKEYKHSSSSSSSSKGKDGKPHKKFVINICKKYSDDEDPKEFDPKHPLRKAIRFGKHPKSKCNGCKHTHAKNLNIDVQTSALKKTTPNGSKREGNKPINASKVEFKLPKQSDPDKYPQLTQSHIKYSKQEDVKRLSSEKKEEKKVPQSSKGEGPKLEYCFDIGKHMRNINVDPSGLSDLEDRAKKIEELRVCELKRELIQASKAQSSKSKKDGISIVPSLSKVIKGGKEKKAAPSSVPSDNKESKKQSTFKPSSSSSDSDESETPKGNANDSKIYTNKPTDDLQKNVSKKTCREDEGNETPPNSQTSSGFNLLKSPENQHAAPNASSVKTNLTKLPPASDESQQFEFKTIEEPKEPSKSLKSDEETPNGEPPKEETPKDDTFDGETPKSETPKSDAKKGKSDGSSSSDEEKQSKRSKSSSSHKSQTPKSENASDEEKQSSFSKKSSKKSVKTYSHNSHSEKQSDGEGLKSDKENHKEDASSEDAVSSDSKYSQSGSTNSLSSMSEDTGQEMNGRLTSIQLGIFTIVEAIQQQAVNVMGIAQSTSGIHSMMSDMLDMQSEAVDHLAKIEKNTNELPIIRQDIAKIKTNTSALTTKK